MGNISRHFTVVAVYACIFFVLAAAAIGAAGIAGVRTASSSGVRIAADELATATTTAEIGQLIDAVNVSGQAMALTADPRRRAQLADVLYSQQIPAVDVGIVALRRQHEGDGLVERADISQLADQWTAVREVLNPAIDGSRPVPDPALAAALTSAMAPLRAHIAHLVAVEGETGISNQTNAAAAASRTLWRIIGAVAIAALVIVALGWFGSRRLGAAVAPAEQQAELAKSIVMIKDETDAHTLLQSFLQLVVRGSSATILNRNNSADRLQAVTALPEDSPLIESLEHAEPSSCLAVRSSAVHDEDDRLPALLACPVCSTCPGKSTCAPLTVGGEVIGSVLLNRATAFNAVEHEQIAGAVRQAAPVLANLRNLAIAELRAATDSLTGLPNKRAAGQTLKRMLAQASRTLTPLSLIQLDLDHFKEINDRFGHPVGDQALASVGAAIRSVLRESDYAGRVGGEEFAIMLPNTALDGAIEVAEKIRAAIAAINLAGADVRISASVGIAGYPDHATGTERLERLADSALYVAKRRGRDRIEIAAPQEEPLNRG